MSEAAKQVENPAGGGMAAEAAAVAAQAQAAAQAAAQVAVPQNTTIAQQPAQQQSVQQATAPQAIAPAPPPNVTTTITTVSALPSQLQSQLQHPMAPPTPQTLTHPGVQHSPMQQVQVIQQPLQNHTYLQQLYNTQGQLLMPGNIQLHPAGMNPGSIQPAGISPSIQSLTGIASFHLQHSKGGGGTLLPMSAATAKLTTTHALLPAAPQVIAAGKTFQHNQLAPHMLAAAGYATIPTSAASNQTLVIGQLGVISQPNILPAHSGNPAKQADMQKGLAQLSARMKFPGTIGRDGATEQQPNGPASDQIYYVHPQLTQGLFGRSYDVSPKLPTLLPPPGSNAPGLVKASSQSGLVSQPQPITTQAPSHAMLAGQAQLISPVQATAFGAPLTQGITWATPGGLQSHTLLATAQNPIYIRGAQQESMFIQSPPPQAMPTHNALQGPATIAGPQPPKPRQGMEIPASIQPKAVVPRALSAILPSSGAPVLAGAPPAIRPASSVSTQTSSGNTTVSAASAAQVQTGIPGKVQAKLRSKPVMARPSPPGAVGPGVAPGMVGSAQKADAANQTKPPVLLPATPKAGFGPPKTPQKLLPMVTTATIGPGVNMSPMMSMTTIPVPSGNKDEIPGILLPPPPPTMTILPPPPMPQLQIPQALPQQQPQTIPPPVVSPNQLIAPQPEPEANQNGVDSMDNKEEKSVINGDILENGFEDGKERGPPKALVKPQVLTHVIEGFVIQEASEPFPVSRSAHLTEAQLPASAAGGKSPLNPSGKENIPEDGEPPKKKQSTEQGVPAREDMYKCEFCGKPMNRNNLKKSKRFCSNPCAKRYNVGCTKRVGLFSGQGSGAKKGPGVKGKQEKDWPAQESPMEGVEESLDHENMDSGGEFSLSPSGGAMDQPTGGDDQNGDPSLAQPKFNPLKWSVSEVCEFIRALPGCSDYAEDFAVQEIDGQALMLLKEDHLMQAMSMKLGPALKICAQIDVMRGDAKEK